MILTRRGYAVLAVVVLALANAALYGPRSLHAVAAPAAVAVVAALVLVRRVDRPAFERVTVDEGFLGESHTVELRLSAGTSFTGHVHDDVGEGLEATGNELTTGIGDTTVAYDVTFARRGVHELGPATVTARDVLGLAERTFAFAHVTEVLVYPRVRDLSGRARHELNLLPDLEFVSERGEFDNLREYERGDALRDIDWKSSAKAPGDDLVVKEYVDEADIGEVRIAAETAAEPAGTGLGGDSAARSADAMAEAAASVAVFMLDAGLSVGVATPDGVLDPDEARDQRRAVLRLLARTGAGSVAGDERAAADLLVRADGTDVTVVMEDREVPFERLTGEEFAGPERAVPAAGG